MGQCLKQLHQQKWNRQWSLELGKHQQPEWNWGRAKNWEGKYIRKCWSGCPWDLLHRLSQRLQVALDRQGWSISTTIARLYSTRLAFWWEYRELVRQSSKFASHQSFQACLKPILQLISRASNSTFHVLWLEQSVPSLWARQQDGRNLEARVQSDAKSCSKRFRSAKELIIQRPSCNKSRRVACFTSDVWYLDSKSSIQWLYR